MKKIFSLALMATALLISGQVKAVNVSNPGEIQKEIDKISAGQSVEIVLTQPIIETATIQIYAKYADAGKKVTIDLGGFTLTNATSATMFELFKGELTIKNGTVTGTTPIKFEPNSTTGLMDINKGSEVIRVYGVYQDEQNWSILNIEKDAKIIGTKSAVCVYEFIGTQYYAKAKAEFAGQLCDGMGSNLAPTDASLPAYKCNKNMDSLLVGLTNPIALAIPGADQKIDFTSRMPKYGTSVAKGSKGTSASDYKPMNYVTAGWVSKANGVVVNIKGYVEGYKYAIKVNGNLNQKTTYQPQMNILASANVVCFDGQELEQNQEESVAIYASGIATWNIAGHVQGNVGVYVKGGTVNLNDAVVEATGDHYTNVAGTGSGVSGASGCAIVIESNKNYGGGSQVTINGDTKVSASDGYAIEETVTTGEPAQLTGVTINGGIIDANTGGGIKVTSEAVSEGKVIIYGGSVEGDSLIVGDEPVSVDSIKAEGTSTINLGTEDHPIIIVTKGDPAPEVTVDINDAEEDKDATLSASDNMVMTADTKVGILYINKGTKLVIGAGKTLEAKKIIMGEEDQIVVPYNGKLIITGNEGLYAHNENNLILEAKGDTLATLLFKYSVAQNKQPMATVYYNAICKQVGATSRTWSRMSTVFTSLTDYYTANKDTITLYPGKTWNSTFQYWDANEGWKVCENDFNGNPILGAFSGISLSNRSKYGTAVYKFQGQLQGVKEGVLDIKQGWNYFGNTFAAPMDLIELLTQLPSNIAGLKLWDAARQKFVDVNKDLILDDMSDFNELPAMQTFMFNAPEAKEITLDYKKLIWDYNVNE